MPAAWDLIDTECTSSLDVLEDVALEAAAVTNPVEVTLDPGEPSLVYFTNALPKLTIDKTVTQAPVFAAGAWTVRLQGRRRQRRPHRDHL